jgi:hypothetical protein
MVPRERRDRRGAGAQHAGGAPAERCERASGGSYQLSAHTRSAEQRRSNAPAGSRRHAEVLVRERRDALRQRAWRIRRSVAAVAVTLFAVAFLVVYVQLASGHDPALVANADKRGASGAGVSRETRSLKTAGSSASGGEAEPSESSGSGSEASGGASAVTTSQS